MPDNPRTKLVAHVVAFVTFLASVATIAQFWFNKPTVIVSQPVLVPVGATRDASKVEQAAGMVSSSGGDVVDDTPSRSLPPSSSAPSEQPANSGAAIPASAGGAAPRPSQLADVLLIETINHAEKTEVPFPVTFFKQRVRQELGGAPTSLGLVRIGIAFIEPRESRSRAYGGQIGGYFLVSLPSLPGCTYRSGEQTYSLPDAATGLMSAVNDWTPDIAKWIGRATKGGVLQCP